MRSFVKVTFLPLQALRLPMYGHDTKGSSKKLIFLGPNSERFNFHSIVLLPIRLPLHEQGGRTPGLAGTVIHVFINKGVSITRHQ